MVRLKVIVVNGIFFPITKFQFLMVRLKGYLRNVRILVQSRISIPYGAIKREGCL